MKRLHELFRALSDEAAKGSGSESLEDVIDSYLASTQGLYLRDSRRCA